MARRPHVVILGGGFGGLAAARALRRAPVDVTLIDRRNHHLFQPLLYQVATAALDPAAIAAPIRKLLRRQKNVQVVLGQVTGVDPELSEVHLDEGPTVVYDYLIVATGTESSWFGHEEWREHALGLKSLEEAVDVRRHVLLAFEAAERELDADRRRAQLTFAVVGGGSTGVELAASLAEVRESLREDFRRIDPRDARVVLVEAMDRILPTFPERLSQKARGRLAALGVEVLTGAKVEDVGGYGLRYEGGRVDARTVLWAAGMQGSPVARTLGGSVNRKGLVEVGRDLSVPGHPEIFVVGDLAALEQDGEPVGGVAQAAIQEGRHAAGNVVRLLEGSATEPFHYTDKGYMVALGRGWALAAVRRLQLAGKTAFLAWALVHVAALVGFRNRLVVMIDWAWSYLTNRRNARLIVPSAEPETADLGRRAHLDGGGPKGRLPALGERRPNP